jgi:hypothetical protein
MAASGKSNETGVVRELGLLLRALRDAHGINRARIGYHLGRRRGGSDSAIGRFERGMAQPRNLDLVVAAYSTELEMSVERLWGLALEQYLAQSRRGQ